MSNHTDTQSVNFPSIEEIRTFDSEAVEFLAADCFEVLRERGDMIPYMESDDLAAINATSFLIDCADDDDLEEIYYLIEEGLFEREVF